MTALHTELLVFELNDQQFGVHTREVEEITRAVSCARLPQAPAMLEGVLNFRGTAIPLLDIRARFGLATRPMETSDHLIVARAGDRTVAIRVDRATAVLTVANTDLESIDRIATGNACIAGVATLPGNIVLIHDLSKFLSSAEASELDSCMERQQT